MKIFIFPNFSSKNKGFTILEVIAAIFVLTVGAGAAFVLIQNTLVLATIIENKAIASFLAQEGIEIVRNIRDTTWIKKGTNPALSWDVDLPGGDWQADYLSSKLEQTYNDNSYLNIDSNNFYSYSAGTSTKFKRKITISDKTANKMRVSVQINWSERGRSYKFEALEYITNWYEK